jgi:hypothetical protein
MECSLERLAELGFKTTYLDRRIPPGVQLQSMLSSPFWCRRKQLRLQLLRFCCPLSTLCFRLAIDKKALYRKGGYHDTQQYLAFLNMMMRCFSACCMRLRKILISADEHQRHRAGTTASSISK